MDNDTNGKPKKKRGCLTTLIGFVLIIALIIGGGLMYFRMQQPDEVTYTQEDVDVFYNKLSVAPGDYAFSLIDFMNGDVEAMGQKEVDVVFTSEEITGGIQSASGYLSYVDYDNTTALLNPFSMDVIAAEDISGVTAYGTSSIFGDISIRFTGPDELEILATPTEGFRQVYDYAPELQNYEVAVDRVIGATLYVKMYATYNNGYLNLDATEVRLNGIPVPMNLVDPYESDVANQINKGLNRLNGLEIEIMTINEEGFRFKGMVPASIRSIAN